MLNKMSLANAEVSVVMCTYNGKHYLNEQINSILNQSQAPAEILIFDDASTDGTWEILQQLAQVHPLISIQRNNTNLGYNLNFQQALQAASSEIIAIADQDDIWEVNKIELLLYAWTEDTPMIYCNSLRFTDNDTTRPIPLNNYRRFCGSDARRIFFYNTVSGHAALIKKIFYNTPFR